MFIFYWALWQQDGQAISIFEQKTGVASTFLFNKTNVVMKLNFKTGHSGCAFVENEDINQQIVDKT